LLVIVNNTTNTVVNEILELKCCSINSENALNVIPEMDHCWVQQKQQVRAPLEVQKTMEKQANFGKFEKLSKIQSKEFEAYSWHI